MQKKFIKLFSLVLAAVLVASVVGCSKDSSNDIVIGVLAPLSGTEAYYGKDMQQSYQLACDEINAKGGILGRQLKLFAADDGADANMAASAAAKIVSQKVDFVVGGYASGATIAAMKQFYDENLLLLISCANSTEITKQDLNQSFMLNSPGTHAAVTLTELCKSLGTKKIALVHQGDAYTKNLADICADALPKSGFEIAAVQMIEKGNPDASAIVTAIRSSGADFVYWCGYHSDGSNVIKQLRQGGYQGEIAVGDGSASPDLIKACGEAGEGVYVTSPPFVKVAEGGEAFIKAYKDKFNVEPGNYATLCYDTIYMLKAAIEKANTTDFAAVRDAVQAIDYKGLSGRIQFSANRELATSNFMILQIEKGEFKLITPKA